MKSISRHLSQFNFLIHPDLIQCSKKKSLNSVSLAILNGILQNQNQIVIPPKLEFYTKSGTFIQQNLALKTLERDLLSLFAKAGVELESKEKTLAKTLENQSFSNGRNQPNQDNLTDRMEFITQFKATAMSRGTTNNIKLPKSLLFDPKLNQTKQTISIQTLSKVVGWRDLPCLVSTQFKLSRGIFVIPWDASAVNIQTYLNEHKSR